MRSHPADLAVRAVAVVAAALLVGACSGASDDAGRATTTTAPATTAAPDGQGDDPGRGPAAADACERPVADAPPVEAVAGTPSDRTLTSFDGTELRVHWFPAPGASADEPAPTVLNGPGWSLAGDTSREKSPLFGALGIGQLNDAGYNVLTWDPRGFGASTGTVTVDDPAKEGRDVSRVLDWLATLPEVLTDRDGDPRVAMIGFSYGGGIQLATASADCRLDALVPGLAWHSLETSLYRNETVKIGWSQSLVTFAGDADLDPHIRRALESGQEHGTISREDQDWFRGRGPTDAVGRITAPTLFVQGTVDTLFGLDEAIANHRLLAERDVPTAMAWFCGGHGTCLTEAGRTDFVESATLAWLDRWLRDDGAALPPAFQTVDQDGRLWTAPSLPEADAALTGSGSGSLRLVATGGSGPLAKGGGDALGSLVADITPARAEHAVEVALSASADGLVLGAPELTLRYRGTVTAHDLPTRLFAQLVDDESGHVIGNQVTPIPVTLDGAEHEVTVALETVVHRVRPGATITLQVVASTVAYATPQLGGEVDLRAVAIEVPVVTEGLTEERER